jgi:uncharacterized protein (TIGR00299 family) protein
MRIAYLDCFSGMSGDMFLGALVDAGVSPELLKQIVNALNVGAQLQVSRVNRSGIVATKIDVFINGEKELPREEWAAQEHEHNHEHSQTENHTHPHTAPDSRSGKESAPHEHDHAPRHQHHHHHGDAHPHGRSLTQIKALIAQASISERAKKTATAIFQALGEAEAKVHSVDIESVHFHEVGAADAIVDIVCAAVGADALAVDEIICSPLNVGGGTVKCAHGVFPVPAPATVELLTGVPVYSSDIQKELVTPTGAAIVKVLATRFGAFPKMIIAQTGYGAGTRDLAGHPNVVRLVIGEAAAFESTAPARSSFDPVSSEAIGSISPEIQIRENSTVHTASETISVLEANLDDLNPQVFGYVMDRLFEEGALDAFGIPVQMKKNRPGMLLTVLCKTQDADKLTNLIFTETTTLGIRRREEQRRVLSRRWVSVATPWGEVRIKVASMNGTVTNYAPEYEDCRKIAFAKHVPLKMVMQEAVQQYLLDSAKKH